MLEHLGNIGDFLGGIGVVVTLIYLASQIRQNTNTVRATGAAANDELLTRMAVVLAQDSESRRVYFGGLQNYESLSADDRNHFALLLGAYLANINSAVKLHSHGSIDDGALTNSLNNLSWLVSQPGFPAFWTQWGGNMDPSLRARVNGILAEAEDLSAAQQSAAADSA